jgi:hypothetical protein
MKKENELGTFEILWINETEENLRVDFAGWSINLEPGGKTPFFVMANSISDSDGNFLMEVLINDQESEYVKWELSDTEFHVFEKPPGDGPWQHMLDQKSDNPLYVFQLELNSDGIVIVGTIETGVDPLVAARMPAELGL